MSTFAAMYGYDDDPYPNDHGQDEDEGPFDSSIEPYDEWLDQYRQETEGPLLMFDPEAYQRHLAEQERQ